LSGIIFFSGKRQLKKTNEKRHRGIYYIIIEKLKIF